MVTRNETGLNQRDIGILGGDGPIWYLKCGDGYLTIYICQKLQNYTLYQGPQIPSHRLVQVHGLLGAKWEGRQKSDTSSAFAVIPHC